MENLPLLVSDRISEEVGKGKVCFLYITEGTMIVSLVSLFSHDIILQAGDALMYSGVTPLDYIRKPSSGMTDDVSCLFLSFQGPGFEEHIGPMLLDSNPISRFLFQQVYGGSYENFLTISCRKDPMIKDILSNMLTEFRQDEPYRMVVLGHLLALFLVHLIREHKDHCHQEITAPISQEGYQIMEDIIHSDFRLTLDDIAKKHHIAPSYASRYVKKTTGTSFSDIMSKARDRVACLMLTTSPKSIQAISEQVGYDNPENFVRTFKKKHGCTPTEFRSN